MTYHNPKMKIHPDRLPFFQATPKKVSEVKGVPDVQAFFTLMLGKSLAEQDKLQVINGAQGVTTNYFVEDAARAAQFANNIKQFHQGRR